jgi:plasmid stabilization system protein ParE
VSPRRAGYRMTADSSADLRGIAAYIGQDRPGAARRVLQALRETFRRIAANPHVGTSCEEMEPGLRCFTAKSPAQRYVILFRPSDSARVEIVAVLDGAQDWPPLLGGR